jgi:hypothetical protein
LPPGGNAFQHGAMRRWIPLIVLGLATTILAGKCKGPKPKDAPADGFWASTQPV